MRKWRMLAWLCAAALLMGLMAGCGADGKATSGETGKASTPSELVKSADKQEITLNLGEEPPSLDAGTTTDTVSFDVVNQIAEGLTRAGEGGKIVKGSGQAADWTVSDDGLTYTFKLKDGLKWSDGKPLTSQDFVYSWFRALDPKTGSQYNYQLFYIKGAEKWSSLDTKAADFAQQYEALKKDIAIKAVDDKTIQVTLERPTPYFLNLTAFPTYLPVRQDLVEQYKDKYAADPDKMAYNGPFIMESWQHENEIILKKNPNYWDASNVKLEKVTFKMVKDSNTAVNMFEANQLDRTGLPGTVLAEYAGKPGFSQEAEATAWYLEFNMHNNQKAYLQNVHVRRALSLAIDRQTFVDSVMKNGSLAATALVPPTIHIAGKGYRDVAGTLLPAKADPTAAQQELAAGLKELGIDKLPAMDFLTGQSDSAKKYAQGVQGMVQQNLPGVTLNLVPVEFKVRLDRMRKGDFDIVFAGWGADYDDPMTFMDMWISSSSYNDPHWSNKQYDQLIDTAKKSADPDVRAKSFADAEKILTDELPIAPIYWPATNRITKPWLKGVLTFSVGPDIDLKYASVAGKNAK